MSKTEVKTVVTCFFNIKSNCALCICSSKTKINQAFYLQVLECCSSTLIEKDQISGIMSGFYTMKMYVHIQHF